MIALGGYIIVQSMALGAGIGLGVTVLQQPRFNPGDSVVSLPISIGMVAGLILGLIFVLLFASTRNRNPYQPQLTITSVPLWLGSIFFGYALSGLMLWVLSGLPLTDERPLLDWRIVLATGLLGSMLGLLSGSFLSWQFARLTARPALTEMLPPLLEGMEEFAPPDRAASPGEKRLSDFMLHAARRHKVKCRMQKLQNSFVVQFKWNNLPGNEVIVYVICSGKFPDDLPTDVKIEVNYSDGRAEERAFNQGNLQRMPRHDLFYYIISDARQIAG